MGDSPGRGRLLMVEQGGRGGVGDYTGQLVASLAARGWKVDLATADDHLLGSIPGVEVEPVFHYARGVTPLERVLRRAKLGAVLNGLYFLRSLPRLLKLARRARLVHTQGWEVPEIGLVAVVCMRLAGARVVQTLHGIVERSGRLERTRRLEAVVMGRLASRTIVHTQADLAGLPPSVRARTVVIPHGEYGGLARTGGTVPREQAREALGVPPGAHATLLFGQLRADKGLPDAVAAANRLTGLHLLIGGQDLGALAELSAELERPPLSERVTVREGFLSMNEAAELFAAADSVVLPYKAASQSGVLLLAYGFHRPVVIYPAGGLVEAVLDGETGWVCARPDVDSLVETLGAAIAAGPQESARRGEAGARLADERYSWRAIAERTESEVYEQVRAVASERDELRSARLLLGPGASEQDLATPAVRAAVRSMPFPARPRRLAHQIARKRGRLGYEQAVAEPLGRARCQALGEQQAEAPPRFLVRVDEFPHYMTSDEPGRYGTAAYERFHETMTSAGVPYLIAVLPRPSHAPLDPAAAGSRELDEGERAMLARLAADPNVELALHGLDHRTRHASPRQHSELSGLDTGATERLLDAALGELAPLGIAPRVFVPPYNRFDAAQYEPLARRFRVVCGGPESIGLLGFHRTPLWRGEAVYLPSYEPLYGHAREVLAGARRLIERRDGLWSPIVLHWGWERDENWMHLERLCSEIAPFSSRWQEFLDAVDTSAAA